jgi:hypothetical protein
LRPQGLGQNPSVEEVQNALKEEHDIETIKMYKMKGTNRPKYLVITDKTITQNQLETQARRCSTHASSGRGTQIINL